MELDLDFIEANILSKFHQDWVKIVTSRVLIVTSRVLTNYLLTTNDGRQRKTDKG